MLLTLTTRSLQPRIKARGRSKLNIEDIPRHTIEQLNLRGLVLDTDLLRGWSLDQLDRLRNMADQSGCPCLVLRESTPIAIGAATPAAVERLQSRLDLVARAGHRLGCNAVAVQPVGVESDEHVAHAADFLRQVMDRVDRMEMNLLLEPGDSRLKSPEGQIELIKKVGGFRIGTMPNFGNAIESGDCASVLRQTAPYASAILATCPDVKDGELAPADREHLRECVTALKSVGYEQIVAIDYVGSDDPEVSIDAARREITAVLEEE